MKLSHAQRAAGHPEGSEALSLEAVETAWMESDPHVASLLQDDRCRVSYGSFVQREAILFASAPGTHMTRTFAPAGPVLWRILSGGFT